MKKILLTFAITASIIASYSQVVDPKKIKPIEKLDVVPLPVRDKLFIDILVTGVFYISSGNFWAVNTQQDKLGNTSCPVQTDVYQWRFIKNTDGTYSVISQSNGQPKLVYKRSTIVLPGRTGISGSPSQNDGYNIQYPTARTSAAESLTDKFWLNRVTGQDYWLVPQDRRDSAFIHLYTTAEVNTVNFDFSNLTGWVADAATASNAFTNQPSNINFIPFFDSPVVPAMPLGGSYWKDLETSFFSVNTRADNAFINTARPGTNHWIRPDEAKTGVLTSLPFVMCGDKISYKIAGTQDAANIKVEFLQKLAAAEPGAVSLPDGYYKIINSNTGHNNDVTRRIVVNAADQKSKVCRFRITDNSASGHIIVDEINIAFTGQVGSDPIPASPEIPTAKPIWGAIDMHTHPMSYLGMGGKLMHGTLDGDPAVALGNCNCTHGGWGTDNTCGNFLRAEIVNMVDEHNTAVFRYKPQDMKVPHADHPHDGYPAMANWPTQQSMTHQQMWYDWIKRAKEGGLTAIIALTVNSEILGRVLGGDGPFDDKSVANRQIDSLIAFVYRHREFLDTVTSSARMRQVIRSGRMAVIIGMEVDNLGDFYQNVPVTNEQVRNEIARLKSKGVRYVFPIHVTDNKFGGTAVYKELFNFNNRYVTAQPLTGTVPVEAYPPVLPGHLYNVETTPDGDNVHFKLDGKTFALVSKMRPLTELIDAGGFPILPPPLDVPSLAVKPIVDPILGALRASQQYQLAKKIFMDVNSPQFAAYERTPAGHRNVLGISETGRFAIQEMMRQGMMIDVDHASEKTVNDIIAIAQSNHNYPLNSGHNGLRAGPDANEKTRTPEQLRAIKDLGGMFGMGWEGQNPVQFNANYRLHWGAMGGRSTSFGSDIDGYATTPEKPASPSQFINYTNASQYDFLRQYTMAGSPRKWDYNTAGMAHIGMVPDFFEALKKAGAPSQQLNSLLLSAEYFAQMWERCETTAPMVSR